MPTKLKMIVLTLVLLLALPVAGFCGGAWVPKPGEGDFQLGYSRKTASSSWNRSGESFTNMTTFEGRRVNHYHDFRYVYLSGDIGLLPRLSTRFLVTYLYGLEGPHEDLEKNAGMSDAWFGLKYALAEGSWPMALSGTIRTPYFYDQPGAYSRYLFDAQGNRRGVSPEWRGVLKRDYTLSYLLSHSYRDGAGWLNFEAGYTWREGAPADALPIYVEVGYPLPWRGLALKGIVNYVGSMANDSPRKPDDRFGVSATTNFNDASFLRAGAGVIVPLYKGTSLELGYSQWLMGESARRYREPYLSVGKTF